jgi:pyruvate formate-lyase/glycerol dehydratase family glycyl radical enzyme
MNQRIQQLRDKTLSDIPTLSSERAGLLTDFYRSPDVAGLPVPIARAKAFAYIMAHKELYLGDNEIIVGERGPEPKATPTYPEICVHSRQDLEILNARQKIPFRVRAAERPKIVDEISPFWQGKAIRDRMFAALDQAWKEAYAAGVFTEFMEQRAPGHTVMDDKIYHNGMTDFISRIDQRIAELDFLTDDAALAKKEQLQAMQIAAGGLITLGQRYAERARTAAAGEKNQERRSELLEIARICHKVPANKPDTFHEALQYYWFVHLGVITELNTWDSFNPGRLDQHLLPFYRAEVAAGSLDEDRAKELLQAFWIKFNNQPAPPKVGITAKESNTYTDFSLINVGGVKADGSDAVNELSYIILDVIEEMRLLQPSSMVQISRKNPDRFVKRALKIVKTGFGQPSIFNTDAIIQEMLRHGKSITDARNGGASGCVETGAFGKEAYILTGYFNLVKILELTLNDGFDPLTQKQLGPRTGNPANFESYADLFAAYQKQLKHFAAIKLKGNRIIERLYAKYLPAPFLSILIDDCIATGRDYNDGGARYNTSYVQGVGLGTLTDTLAALKYHVYDKARLTMADMLKALKADFVGYENMQSDLRNATPKYGNDDDYADDIMRDIFEVYYKAIDGHPNTRGGFYRINLLPTTSHVYFGSVVGATPDGRKAKTPLSEGISPVQGADRNGPTAVIKSAAKMDHLRTGGTLLNQKLTPQLLADEAGINAVTGLIRAYFKMDGHHIQFNVVDAATLQKAKANPEVYKDLIVRVAGYSDYFVDLTDELQDEIIRRTEQAVL